MKRYWQPDEIDFLTEHYADNYTEDLALALCRTLRSVYSMARILGLKKSPEMIQLIGLQGCDHPNSTASRFKKGQKSHNKGVPMSPEVKEKIKHTFFAPGRMPHNTRHDGARTKRSDGYWWVRLSLGKWKQLHVVLWEQANRPLLKGELVKFKDGNRDNCTLDNLYLSSRSENMLANTIRRYPEELIQTIKTVSKLNKVIKDYEKRHHSSSKPAHRGDGETSEPGGR